MEEYKTATPHGRRPFLGLAAPSQTEGCKVKSLESHFPQPRRFASRTGAAGVRILTSTTWWAPWASGGPASLPPRLLCVFTPVLDAKGWQEQPLWKSLRKSYTKGEFLKNNSSFSQGHLVYSRTLQVWPLDRHPWHSQGPLQTLSRATGTLGRRPAIWVLTSSPSNSDICPLDDHCVRR